MKLREVYEKDRARRRCGKAEISLTSAIEKFFLNIQNVSRNSMRCSVEGDELSKMTEASV